MRFFVDTADLEQIKKINKMFPLDGVTTNPSLVAKSGKNREDLIRAISEEVKGPVSAEVLALSEKDMLKEARSLARIHPQVVVKLPLTVAGLMATKQLQKENIPTNLTLCFSALQALMAARAGARFVSIFVGRLDDTGASGMEVVSQVIQMFSHYKIKTKVLVASIRHVSHVLSSAKMGADAATLPPALFEHITEHPLTDKGLAQFLKDAKAT